MTKQLSEMTIEELGAHMADVFTVMRHKAYSEGYGRAKFDAAMDRVAEIKPKETPIQTKERLQREFREQRQAKRDRIVEQAKADVEELITEYQLSSEEVDITVDKGKRTVTTEVKHIFSGKILAKGIAKCAPGDCFNVHIGKAIALRRALGLEVPVEYTSTPQPTEVRVGDKIRLKLRSRFLNGNIETVSGFYRENKPLTLESPGHIYEDQYEIIDDSREGVTE